MRRAIGVLPSATRKWVARSKPWAANPIPTSSLGARPNRRHRPPYSPPNAW